MTRQIDFHFLQQTSQIPVCIKTTPYLAGVLFSPAAGVAVGGGVAYKDEIKIHQPCCRKRIGTGSASDHGWSSQGQGKSFSSPSQEQNSNQQAAKTISHPTGVSTQPWTLPEVGLNFSLLQGAGKRS